VIVIGRWQLSVDHVGILRATCRSRYVRRVARLDSTRSDARRARNISRSSTFSDALFCNRVHSFSPALVSIIPSSSGIRVESSYRFHRDRVARTRRLPLIRSIRATGVYSSFASSRHLLRLVFLKSVCMPVRARARVCVCVWVSSGCRAERSELSL